MNTHDLFKKIERSRNYSLIEVAELVNVELETIIKWKTIGIPNHDGSQVYKLGCITEDDQKIVPGREVLRFIFNASL